MTAVGGCSINWLRIVRYISHKAFASYPWIPAENIESAAWLAVGQANELYEPGAGASKLTWLFHKAPFLLSDELRKTEGVRRKGSPSRPRATLETDLAGLYAPEGQKFDWKGDGGQLQRGVVADQEDRPFDLEELTKGLAPEDKVLVSLYFDQDYTMNQAAEVLGVSESRVSQRMSELLKRSKVLLKAKFPKEFEGW